MNAILNDDSSPARCGIVTYDAATFARLLHLPEDAVVDTVQHSDDKSVSLVISGHASLPVVEPGYPVPRVQLVGLLGADGRVTETAILPIDADLASLTRADEGQAA